MARHDLETVLALPAERIEVMTKAADPIFAPVSDASAHEALRARLAIPRHAPVPLYVGGMAPHKDLARTIQAFDLTCRGNGLGKAQLLLTGDPKGDGFHSNSSKLLDAVSTHRDLTGHVVFTGFLQGFGLSTIEAMTCGTPVLRSTGTAVEKVAGAVAQAVRRVVAEPDERRRLGARVLVRAQSCSWRHVAELALMPLEHAAREAR